MCIPELTFRSLAALFCNLFVKVKNFSTELESSKWFLEMLTLPMAITQMMEFTMLKGVLYVL